MPYVQLAVAIACEIGASSALKATHGFTVLAPSVATIALYGLSFYLFSLVLNVLDLASAYASGALRVSSPPRSSQRSSLATI